jgi:hypothetical protein
MFDVRLTVWRNGIGALCHDMGSHSHYYPFNKTIACDMKLVRQSTHHFSERVGGENGPTRTSGLQPYVNRINVSCLAKIRNEDMTSL